MGLQRATASPTWVVGVGVGRQLRVEALMSLQSGRTHVKEVEEVGGVGEVGGVEEDGVEGGWRMILRCCRRHRMTMTMGVCMEEEGVRGERRISLWRRRGQGRGQGRGRHSMGWDRGVLQDRGVE